MPGLQGLFRESINQVEIHVIETCSTRAGYCFNHIEEIVSPFKHPQFFTVRGLHAQTNSINSDCSILQQSIKRNCAGVYFNCDLGIFDDFKFVVRHPQNRSELIWQKQGWRSPTKENRVKGDFFRRIQAGKFNFFT